jgi:multidrug efflux pump subunit AcrA (membrane-fusion protein)
MRQQSDVQQQIRQTIQEANQAARDAAQTARQAAQDAKQAAADAKNLARVGADVQPPVPPAVPAPPAAPGTIVIPTDAGQDININVDGKGIHVSQNGTSTVIPIHDVVPRGAVLMTYAVCASLAFVIVGWPLARAMARWIDRRGTSNRQSATLSADVQARLDAMERNIDTVAVELERVSEGQRFTNKLLSERSQMPAGNFAAAGERAPAQGA